ncbi:hypothetical protein BD413DRAFT_604783 [Trametes elegans]|nr:hypothetical protein BD413DRAFT_604783 [Trametes elegans]
MHRATPSPASSSSSSRRSRRRDDSSSPTNTLPPGFSFTPVRRPRRGERDNIPSSEWDASYERCFSKARMLRFSALARVAAAHPSTSKEYRPLRVPPNPNSPYAKHGLLMARLELIDSLLHFVYGLWCKDYSAHTCYRAAWRTVNEFLAATRAKVISESQDEREKAFIGLLWMIESFIHGRKLRYQVVNVDRENDHKMTRLNIQWKAEKAQAEARAAAAAEAQASSSNPPNMLPSPASSNSANSSHSTPIGGHGQGTPARKPTVDREPSKDENHRPGNPHGPPPGHITIPVQTGFIVDRKAQSHGILQSSATMQAAQLSLNLPVMARHYPRTTARMVLSSLGPQDEHEPDFQDDDGELYWPTQVITGEGLGWACLMGMAMVKEFGKEYGYQGVNGVIPRQNGEEVSGFPEPKFIPSTR